MPEIYNGLVGNIKNGTAAIGHMSGWNLELSRDIAEVVSFGSTSKEKIPGIKDWKADADGTADFSTGSGQNDLLTAYENGTKLTFGFYLDGTKYFTGDAYIESLSISHDAEGVAEISISVSGTGGVVLTLPV